MRQPILLSAMLCLAIVPPTLAQTFPAKMNVVLKEAEVRSGPSKQYSVTSKLALGDAVTVLRESKDQPGWYEIEPPKGSFSWISGKYVKQTQARYGYVECAPSQPAPVYAGSGVDKGQPNREIMKLTGGSILNFIGPPQSANGETWFPIQPHPGEVRYLQVEAVKAGTVVASTRISPPNFTSPAGYTGNSVLAEAEKAAAAKDTNRARDLFQQVANSTTSQNEKFYALNRVRELSTPPVPATTTALSPIGQTASATLQTLRGPAWSTYGRLRDMKQLSDNGQALYALEDASGRTPIFVTTIPGKSLQSYVGRMIAVYGPTMYRSDSAVRMQFIVVSHVALP